jgi:hypothetical protein
MSADMVSQSTSLDDEAYAEERAQVTVAHVSDRAAVISLDSMRSAMPPNFEQDDLDVPAFLRKRNDLM